MVTIQAAMENLKELGINPVTAVIGSTQQLFQWDEEKVNELKGYLISQNFKYHYENNSFYRMLCEDSGVTPADVQSLDDIQKIPLIPVTSFKRPDSHLLLSTSLENIEFEMRSTGTSGIPSISRRDAETLNNCVFSIYAMYREMFAFSRGAGLFLFPSPEEMPEMGMVKVLNMLSGLFDATRCLVKRASFKPKEAIETLEKWQNIHTRHIIGPPFLIYKLVNYLKTNNIHLKLDQKTMIINLGGWKRFSGMEIPREQYNKECAEFLGIPEENIRDMYGLVESNILAIECEKHSKHVPPWVHFSLRNPKNLAEEVPQGKRGVLAIFDPTSLSYPGFIQTEDLVYLKKENTCECGRNGQKVVYLSRVAGAEIGCCAINLEKHMDAAEAKSEMAEV
ncbi:LuxE family acyl-protein synthetase [Lysinibacillus pakistanensis]|uniref:LuxE family acyl-protein synthetase n=1 Tax=Lysinibacillus pakistanensis TaxID=759811 RepID=A0AAX3WXV7_9BACI|nr:LuxE family acyl-protein synthetase [Lysinibacillus pakistanensis]MDM5232009.1 LuxE family acyl-protein synthetase [Lysinibacillus pakistanensis]WHY47535.1 LuxE family acyl-protein synthetase [Lysinibacillus pakistanensis]WHY52545.1 LuxE family acyl-protein synthetase [Lysinibacillus pakistanensis]